MRKVSVLLILAGLVGCDGGVEVNGVDTQGIDDDFIAAFGQPELLTTAAVDLELGAALGLVSSEPLGKFLDGAFPATTPGTPSDSGSNDWVQQDYYPGLTFVEPIRVVEHPIENRLIVVGKDGLGWSVTHEQGALDKTLFFDIQPIMHGKSGVGEGGISDMVFHPEFGDANSPNSSFIYISYRWSPTQSGTFTSNPTVNGYNRLSRFSVVNGQVDIATEQLLISQYDREQWHIGMDLFFGDDGFLYISSGDEGNCCNREATNTQRLDGGLFSGILRIDVDKDATRSHPIRRQPTNLAASPQSNGPNWPDSVTQNYFIPNDNPFVAADGSQLEEFYSIGLRHPWTITQDPVTQLIYAADVGQSTMEEVNLVQKGDNHQWAYTEGAARGLVARPATIIGKETPPIFSYPRTDGQAVIGAGVYRGSQFPDLFGKYLFSDFVTGKLWTAEQNGNDYDIQEIGTVTAGFPNGINSYLMDSKGNILMAKTSGALTDGGSIQFLTRANRVTASQEPPLTLSDTGAFADISTLAIRSGCIPYDMNVPFWSDNAIKSRWMCIPSDGIHDTDEEQIGFSKNGDWTMPVGSVTIKHFELATDNTNPTATTRLETRFMIHGTDGWYGVTYRWDTTNNEAFLLTAGAEQTFTVDSDQGQFDQNWIYPSRGDCSTCHNAVAGFVLGPKTRQLNKDHFYPKSGVTANQIETLNSLGLLNPAIPENEVSTLLSSTLTSASMDDEQASLSDKARSYLDSNCGYCHRPNGVRAEFDARLTTPLASQNLVNGPVNEALGLPDPSVIAPGDLANSMIFHRANSAGTGFSMPPLGKDLVHQEGVDLLSDWINALDSFVVGNDTTTDGGFIDGHHPSLYINEQDTYSQGNESGSLFVKEFSFYARRLGNPVTPIVVRVDRDNEFTVLAIGTTRTPTEYSVGENSFDFLEGDTVALQLDPGDVIATGFLDSNPDGTGWGAGTVIPAEAGRGNTQDEIFALLPNPLIAQANGFVQNRDSASVAINQKISSTNAGKALLEYTQLRRSYKFAVTFGLAEPIVSNNNSVPVFTNGSFEQPVVNRFLTYPAGSNAIPGWTITSGTVEIDRTVWPGFDGLQSMDLSGNTSGALEQALSGFDPGTSYAFKFEYALHRDATSARSANVFINNQVVDTISAGTGAIVPNYQTFEITFTAPSSGIVNFGFQSLSPDSLGVVIDNLRIERTDPLLPVISNPSFETPVVSRWALASGGSSALPGWTVTSLDAEIDRTPWPASEGNQSMDLNGSTSSSIEQTIDGFTEGASYALLIDYGLHRFASVGATAQVLIDDQVVEILNPSITEKVPAYQTLSVPFTASGSTVKLGFKGEGTNISTGVVIDNLRLVRN